MSLKKIKLTSAFLCFSFSALSLYGAFFPSSVFSMGSVDEVTSKGKKGDNNVVPPQSKRLQSGPPESNSSPKNQVEQMNNALIHKLLNEFSEDVEGENGFWRFSYQDYVVQVITDESANRMRIIVPIAQDDILDEQLSYRLMQANFDSALDARYAIANKLILSTFVHPLKELNEDLFFSGLAQSLILAKTFGTTFSSGALIFNGGDSAEENRKLYEDIIKQTQKRAI